MNNDEAFVTEALKEKSIMWEEKTLRQVAFALHDTQNPDALIDKLPSRGAYDCVKLYAVLNFLILESVENFPDLSISKLKHCAERLKRVDHTVSGLVNLKMDEVERRIQRFVQISKNQLDIKNANDMIKSFDHVKRNEPDLYSYQSYYSIYLLFLFESSGKDPSQRNMATLLHIMKQIFLGMIEMPR